MDHSQYINTVGLQMAFLFSLLLCFEYNTSFAHLLEAVTKQEHFHKRLWQMKCMKTNNEKRKKRERITAPQNQPSGCNLFQNSDGSLYRRGYHHNCEDLVIHNVLRQPCLSDGMKLNWKGPLHNPPGDFNRRKCEIKDKKTILLAPVSLEAFDWSTV